MGLFEGKMGIAISFLIYGRETANSVYSDFGDYLLDGLLAKVDKRIGLGFATGLSGIGWGIEYLIQNGFVCCNSHEVCKEIDELILLYDLRRMKDFLLSTGIEGLLHYVLARIKGNISQHTELPFDRLYLAELHAKLYSADASTMSPAAKELRKAYSGFLERGVVDYELNLDRFVAELKTETLQLTHEKLGLDGGLASLLVYRAFKN